MRPLFTAILTLTVTLFSISSQAGVVLGGTRLIFLPGAKEANLTVVGDPTTDYLIQSWVSLDPINTKLLPNTQRNPLAVVPALAKIPAGRQQLIRVIYEGAGLPEDRESLFWLNVQEIPPKVEGENTLQIAIRQRIKLLYRPSSIPASSEKSVLQTTWRVEQQGSKRVLHIQNLSPFFVSPYTIMDATEQKLDFKLPNIPPFTTHVADITDLPVATNDAIKFHRINDDGNIERYRVVLSISNVQPESIELK